MKQPNLSNMCKLALFQEYFFSQVVPLQAFDVFFVKYLPSLLSSSLFCF